MAKFATIIWITRRFSTKDGASRPHGAVDVPATAGEPRAHRLPGLRGHGVQLAAEPAAGAGADPRRDGHVRPARGPVPGLPAALLAHLRR
ncbi:hypothetical protein ON010_g5850 [Phytophthora cinnamomi]|nr:hypothetical protein ON010_g5850 [Phytophthora cinnamomi]